MATAPQRCEMKTAELEAERRQSLANFRREHMDELIRCGVPVSLIADHLMVGVELIGLTADGCYYPDADGELAFVSPIRCQYPVTPQPTDPWSFVRCGDLIDLLAWDPAADDWALRTGNAAWLGCSEVQDYPELVKPGPTRLWRTPREWFRFNCNGLVILSPHRGERYRILSQLHGDIEVEDAAHKRLMDKILKHPWPAPRVRIAPVQPGGRESPNEAVPPPTDSEIEEFAPA
jgi:hypothetical protein